MQGINKLFCGIYLPARVISVCEVGSLEIQ